MSDQDLQAARAMLACKQIGWDYLEAERYDGLRHIVTKDVISSFDTAFAYSQTLPSRMESGFVQFYQALSRGAKKCST